MSKFQCGDHVFLFNSLAMRIEEDEVYGCLFIPFPVEGVEQNSVLSVSEKLAKGQMEVREQYQLCGHQGIVDAGVLFKSEDECREWYSKFFAK